MGCRVVSIKLSSDEMVQNCLQTRRARRLTPSLAPGMVINKVRLLLEFMNQDRVTTFLVSRAISMRCVKLY